jgi:hypothetical protein
MLSEVRRQGASFVISGYRSAFGETYAWWTELKEVAGTQGFVPIRNEA